MKYKNAISGGKEGSDTHDVAISEHIRDEIFGHIESGREYRLKAAGYLMYALEK